MKIKFIFIILLLFNLNSVYAQKNYNLKKEQNYTYNFGKVKEGDILKHTFILKNNTNKNLLIKDVFGSCGCVVPKISNKTLKPKESAKIDVKFNTKGYSGKVEQYIYVHTDDKDNPIKTFKIIAEVSH